MSNGTDDQDEFSPSFGGLSDSDKDEQDAEEPSSYHSGRVRIIGAEPAGDSVREVTGPVEEGHPDLPHWNDAPTGQVPAILDRSSGEESVVAPPTWREEDHDWEAQEDVFEPSMLSGDLPAVGALLDEQQREEADADRQPWHFESDDTLVIPPEPGLEPDVAATEPVAEPELDTGPRRRVSAPPRRARQRREDAETVGWNEPEAAPPDEPVAEPEQEPVGVSPQVALYSPVFLCHCNDIYDKCLSVETIFPSVIHL